MCAASLSVMIVTETAGTARMLRHGGDGGNRVQ
jgi:hypothetical protein